MQVHSKPPGKFLHVASLLQLLVPLHSSTSIRERGRGIEAVINYSTDIKELEGGATPFELVKGDWSYMV